ncbi:HD domain-containing protein [Dyadobacter chenwenxiniae]|uniref:HD domain-containing protein n=1 Tax=Dyadobacter chenwenxiniae TaxID=2906456 RepID=A0A9X1PLD4_9BACT|nr:HD domain-containing protein [Dyadobacter chenwenxiniae]MCF0062993.1 HD domain-containing protein [Dyadobacter chenwenxiniae]UON84833.1 HD domain-containing protein [Dyadobacter chenwenxiniae]
MNVEKAEVYIVDQFRQRLSDTLYYHGLHHTLDVANAALHLATLEGVKDQESRDLLKTAALYHDSGFMYTYKEHEQEGCRIARKALPGFGYSPEQIDIICGMIMATRIPQSPKTHLEQIICDADLDYLGRADFEPIGETLYRELKARGMVTDTDSWNAVQVKFITGHSYWTQSAQLLREIRKQENLKTLL